ncbi:MAG: glycosyltransferase [bacterium]
MITTSFPRFIGDYPGIFVLRLCRALFLLDVEIQVVAPSDRNEPSYEIINGCTVHRFQYFSPKNLQKLAYGPGGIPANLQRNPLLIVLIPFFVVIFFLKTLKVSKNVDIIHAQWLYSGMIAAFVKIMRGTPFVVTLRGSDTIRSGKGGLSHFVSKWVLKHADLVTTVNQDLRHWAIQQGVAPNAVFVIRNGVELNKNAEIKKSNSLCRLIFVGHLVPAKGLNFLIEALAIVYRVNNSVRLTVVGDGVEINPLRKNVQVKGLNAIVDFQGVQPSNRIPQLMQGADCLVLPSLREGTPNVVLEAMACGLPIVASDLPGIREVVQDGITGLLVKPGHTEELAEKILQVIQNHEYRTEMGEKGFQAISELQLGWKHSAKQYLEIYQKTCAVSRESLI